MPPFGKLGFDVLGFVSDLGFRASDLFALFACAFSVRFCRRCSCIFLPAGFFRFFFLCRFFVVFASVIGRVKTAAFEYQGCSRADKPFQTRFAALGALPQRFGVNALKLFE
jgi:hypothetical protein